MNKHLLIILLAICCVLFAALLINRDENRYQTDHTSELFLPKLKAQLPRVAKIQLDSLTETIEIENQNGSWVVVSKLNYPADTNSIRRLIYAMAELRIIEIKTDDPSLLSKIGLDRDSQDSLLIRLDDDNNEIIAEVLFGVSRAPVSGQGQAWFARHPDNNQSWLVSGDLQLDRTVYPWLNKSVLLLETDEIQQVILNPASQESLVIVKSDETGLFELQGLSEDEEVANYKLDIIVESAAGIQLDDVRKSSSAAAVNQQQTTVQLKTSSGIIVDIRIIDPEHGWISLEAGSDTDDKTVIAQTQELNEKWAGWEYRIPGYKLESLLQDKQALLDAQESS